MFRFGSKINFNYMLSTDYRGFNFIFYWWYICKSITKNYIIKRSTRIYTFK